MLQYLHPLPKQRVQIRTRASLAEHLQWALAVELSTIPPYLCALYSIQDNSSDAFQLIRGVVIEEMLHLMLVCNLRNAIGDVAGHRHPDVLAVAAQYPTYIPHHATGGPFVQLQGASAAQVRAVFMGIEQPAAEGSPAEANRFETIGQFYEAIADGFRWLANQEEPLFTGDPALQQTSSYFGGGGGRLFAVTDLRTALRAIDEIIEQGEGATRRPTPRPGDEPFGLLDNYGLRADGTIGPIVGARWEASHYSKFEAIANGVAPIGATWPMLPNPDTARLTGDVRALSQLCDDVYGLLLRGINATVSQPSGPFFSQVLPLMHVALPSLAVALMQTPVYEGGDAQVGPTVGPSFRAGDASIDATLDACRALLHSATTSPSSLQRQVWAPALSATESVLAAMAAGGAA